MNHIRIIVITVTMGFYGTLKMIFYKVSTRRYSCWVHCGFYIHTTIRFLSGVCFIPHQPWRDRNAPIINQRSGVQCKRAMCCFQIRCARVKCTHLGWLFCQRSGLSRRAVNAYTISVLVFRVRRWNMRLFLYTATAEKSPADIENHLSRYKFTWTYLSLLDKKVT